MVFFLSYVKLYFKYNFNYVLTHEHSWLPNERSWENSSCTSAGCALSPRLMSLRGRKRIIIQRDNQFKWNVRKENKCERFSDSSLTLTGKTKCVEDGEMLMSMERNVIVHVKAFTWLVHGMAHLILSWTLITFDTCWFRETCHADCLYKYIIIIIHHVCFNDIQCWAKVLGTCREILWSKDEFKKNTN